jgi:hypothetical protein
VNTATLYKNPWHKPGKAESGPAMYSTDAKPVRIGKYVRYHRIKSRIPSGNCYDFVLNGVCVSQRCGPANESDLDACWYTQDTIHRIFGDMPAPAQASP